MASISLLRTGLAANAATITGLRTAATIPDNPNPPVAVVVPSSLSFNDAFHSGMNTFTFNVLLLVGKVSERSGQNSLDAYCSSTGSSSMKLALESDKTLGGNAYDVRVTEIRNYGEIAVGDVNYLSAEFIVLCYAD
jgi:hypothetical protein